MLEDTPASEDTHAILKYRLIPASYFLTFSLPHESILQLSPSLPHHSKSQTQTLKPLGRCISIISCANLPLYGNYFSLSTLVSPFSSSNSSSDSALLFRLCCIYCYYCRRRRRRNHPFTFLVNSSFPAQKR